MMPANGPRKTAYPFMNDRKPAALPEGIEWESCNRKHKEDLLGKDLPRT
jgi:hypothetical protein